MSESEDGAVTSTSGIKFLVDTNLGLKLDEAPISTVISKLLIEVEGTTDLPHLDDELKAHKPDVAYVPSADFHRLLRAGDQHYVGLAIPTSKYTGLVTLPSVLVVRQDDPATNLMDLEGADCGYIDKSCTSSYFPPAVMLGQKGIKFGEFLKMKPVKAWQGQIDAVVSGEVRATMVPEDVWRTTARNRETTKVVDRYDTAEPALVVARHDLDEGVRKALLDVLVTWVPKWEAIYGCFKPFYYADVHPMFHDLDELPHDT